MHFIFFYLHYAKRGVRRRVDRLLTHYLLLVLFHLVLSFNNPLLFCAQQVTTAGESVILNPFLWRGDRQVPLEMTDDALNTNNSLEEVV